MGFIWTFKQPGCLITGEGRFQAVETAIFYKKKISKLVAVDTIIHFLQPYPDEAPWDRVFFLKEDDTDVDGTGVYQIKSKGSVVDVDWVKQSKR